MEETRDQAAWARRAGRLYAEGPFFARTLNRLRPYVLPMHHIVDAVPQDAHVLDVGCGAGLFLGLLADSGRITRGIGFDMSAPAIALANQMSKNLPDSADVTFLHQAAEDEWPEGLFDVVSVIDVMHHVPPAHQRDVLKAAAAKLKPGGRILYKDMADRPIILASANRLHDLVVAREWINYMPMEDAAETFGALGLKTLAEGSERHFWYQHEFMVVQSTAV